MVRRSTSTTLPVNRRLPRSACEDRLDRIVVAPVGFIDGLPEAGSPWWWCAECPSASPRRRCAAPCRSRRSNRTRCRPCGCRAPSSSSSRRADDDHLVAARIDRGQRRRREIADRKRRHLRLGIGPAHGVGVDHRNAQMRRRHQRLHARCRRRSRSAITPRNLRPRCSSITSTARAISRLSTSRSWVTSGAPILETTATVVVVEHLRVHQVDPRAFAIEPAHVEQGVIGAAAASGAEDPGTDGQRFDVLGGELSHAATTCGGFILDQNGSSTWAAMLARRVGQHRDDATAVPARDRCGRKRTGRTPIVLAHFASATLTGTEPTPGTPSSIASPQPMRRTSSRAQQFIDGLRRVGRRRDQRRCNACTSSCRAAPAACGRSRWRRPARAARAA